MLISFGSSILTLKTQVRLDFDDKTWFVFDKGQKSSRQPPVSCFEFTEDNINRFKKFMFHQIRNNLTIVTAKETGNLYITFNEENVRDK